MASSDLPSTLPAATPERQEPKPPWASPKQEILAAGLLVAITLAALGGVCSCNFINYDDNEWVAANPKVQAGLTLPSFCWAWTTFHAANWHPLTWLSLQLDWQMYRGAAWGFHLTNLLLHLASVLVLFALLRRATGAVGAAPAWPLCLPFTRCVSSRWPGWRSAGTYSAPCAGC